MSEVSKLPESVLFVCSLNSIRSPMAEGLMKQAFGDEVYVQSCGLREGDLNEMMVSVMNEAGIDMRGHVSKSIDALSDKNFDLVIAFSDDIGEAMKAEFGDSDAVIEVWPTPDPTAGVMNVRAMMDNFRAVRTTIQGRISRKFPKNA